MRKINYNLAANRKIDGRAFAMTVTVLFLALAMINAVTVFNLTRLQGQNRAEEKAFRAVARKTAVLQQRTLEQQDKIAAWKKTLNQQLTFANALITRKCFSFVARLNFLEKTIGDGMRIRQLSLVNESAGRITMLVSALAQNELMRLYKKLLPYQLVIANENQSEENYQAKLSFRMEDEKK